MKATVKVSAPIKKHLAKEGGSFCDRFTNSALERPQCSENLFFKIFQRFFSGKFDV